MPSRLSYARLVEPHEEERGNVSGEDGEGNDADETKSRSAPAEAQRAGSKRELEDESAL